MEYRKLGRTGIEVSVVGIGGEGFENKDSVETEALIDCAMENGIHFFDLYNSNPAVRDHVGKALSKYPRDRFVIQGHLCSMWEMDQYRRTRDLGETVQAYEDLLERTGFGYIDVGMIHYIDEQADYDAVFGGEILQYAKELKVKGIVRSLGISTHNPDIALQAAETGIIDVILFSINPAYDMLPASEDVNVLFDEGTFKDQTYEGVDPKRDLLYRTCESAGVALTVMKAYAAGVLLDGQISPFEKALTPVQCLHYCLTRPSVASVTIGVSDRNQILAAASYGIASDSEKDYSEALATAPRNAFRGHCMYCGHCAPCPKKIDVAAVNKYLDLALVQDTVPDTLKNHYSLLEHHADECVQCGSCMKNCPFDVDVIGKMKQAVRTFGE